MPPYETRITTSKLLIELENYEVRNEIKLKPFNWKICQILVAKNRLFNPQATIISHSILQYAKHSSCGRR